MENINIDSIWPGWQIIKEIGSGHLGRVYEAVHKDYSAERYAAIKVIQIPQNKSEIDSLRSEGISLDEAKTYFQKIVTDLVREIQTMESFKGAQNIVSVEDYKVVEKSDEIGWDIYIRMELLTPLNTYICNKTLSEQDIIKLGVDICTALELCARHNVIHRGIKPENIFINQFGDFKLGDLGIVRKLESITSDIFQKGNYNYMAPEVANGNLYDVTTDLYSLGLVLYQLMNKNRIPFLNTEYQSINPNERMTAIRRRIDGDPLPPPCDASTAMAKLILCVCSHDPDKRFVSATAMKTALQSIANGPRIMAENALNKAVYYIANAQEPNYAASARTDPLTQDLNRKTYVPIAPPSQGSTPKQINTLGANKKSKALVIIVAVLTVAILTGSVIFLLPKLVKNNDSIQEGSSADNTIGTASEDGTETYPEQSQVVVRDETDTSEPEPDDGAYLQVQEPVYASESENWAYATLASSDERSVEALVLRELTANGGWSEYYDGKNSDVWLKSYPTANSRVRQITTIITGSEYDLFITNNANSYQSRTGNANQNWTTYDMAMAEYSQNGFDHMYSELDWLEGTPIFDEADKMINGNSWHVYSGYNSGSRAQDYFWIFFFIDESQRIAVEVSFEYVLFSGATLADASFFNEWYLNLNESLLIR